LQYIKKKEINWVNRLKKVIVFIGYIILNDSKLFYSFKATQTFYIFVPFYDFYQIM